MALARPDAIAAVVSAQPEVDAFSKEMMALADEPPTYGNYDVIDERIRQIGGVPSIAASTRARSVDRGRALLRLEDRVEAHLGHVPPDNKGR